MGKKLLALDLSTTSTGWALFDIETKELIHCDILVPAKNPRGTQYPVAQLFKMQDLADKITKLVNSLPDLERIVIEEINRGVSRMGQKTLDGLHFILMDRLGPKIDLVYYRDSDGAIGWRTQLKLILSDQDKLINDQRRKANKKMGKLKGQKLFPIINKKHLACRLVNSIYGTNFDCDLRPTDADRADAVGLGHSILHR